MKIVKVNIGLGIFALLAGLGNIYAGTVHAQEFYSYEQLYSAILQVVLAFAVAFSGAVRLALFLKGNVIGRFHWYIAGLFYAFTVVTLIRFS